MNCKGMFAVVPALLLASGAALAQTAVERSVPAAADARVSIENLAGSVSVRAWEREEVRISGTLGQAVEELRVDGDARQVNIHVVYPRNGRGRLKRSDETNLVIDVPRGVELEVQTVSASIDVDGVAGPRAELRSVSGDVIFTGDAQGLHIGTVSGSVRASGAHLRVAVETVSGRIDVATTSGDIGVRSVSGMIVVDAERIDRLTAATVSSGIELKVVSLTPEARLEAESMSGSISLNLPADLSARLEASTFSGSIRSDFGEAVRAQRGPGQSLQTDAGTGEARVKLNAFSGSVTISRD
jgi:DUF4097 and DUF4098 domain-containing protein YvlB